MARSPLTETIQRVNGMVHYVQQNLSADEYLLFLDLCVPEPEPETAKPAKKKRKSSSKSSRASKLSTTIRDNLQRRVATEQSDNDPNAHCQKEFEGGFVCDEPADANVHHLRGATGYHEFEAGKLSASITEPLNDPGESAATAGAGD
jgi:hypothetical protein